MNVCSFLKSHCDIEHQVMSASFPRNPRAGGRYKIQGGPPKLRFWGAKGAIVLIMQPTLNLNRKNLLKTNPPVTLNLFLMLGPLMGWSSVNPC